METIKETTYNYADALYKDIYDYIHKHDELKFRGHKLEKYYEYPERIHDLLLSIPSITGGVSYCYPVSNPRKYETMVAQNLNFLLALIRVNHLKKEFQDSMTLCEFDSYIRHALFDSSFENYIHDVMEHHMKQ